MVQIQRVHASSKLRLWSRLRVQLGGALLFGALLPAIAALSLGEQRVDFSLIQQTLVGMAAAALLTTYLLRNMTSHPGVGSGYFILPCLLIGYAVAFAAFLFFRLDYIRGLLLLSMILTLAWLWIAHSFEMRARRLRIGVVPFGDIASLVQAKSIEWITLSDPAAQDAEYDALVADFRAELPKDWEAFLAETALEGLPIFHVKNLRESLIGRVEIEHLSENSFGSLIPFMGYLKVRRLIDLATAAVFGVILLPGLLVVALLIKLDSKGPILFRQRRVGYRGAVFLVAKFRTMKHGSAEDADRESAMTSSDDDRVTRIGKFLRRTRIDELPQILNILKGEMSWIGPRPEAEVLSNWYQAELPFYRYRHIVPPGITGWAQVSQGHVADLKQVSHKLQYDFYYIKNFSPWLDALVLARTVLTVISGYGAR